MWPQLIRQFRHYLKLERSLSENSIEAYTRDVEKLAAFAEKEFVGKSPLEMELEHLRRFVNALAALEISAFSQARIISGIKAFYRFLMYEDKIKEDPAQLLEAPKLGRKLPDTLSFQEIELLLEAIPLGESEGHRNRAMLEMLYSSGLLSRLFNNQKNHHPGQFLSPTIEKDKFFMTFCGGLMHPDFLLIDPEVL